MKEIPQWAIPMDPVPETQIVKTYSADVVILGAGHAGTAETGKHRAATRNADGGKAGDCTNISQQRHSDLRREQAAGRLQSSGR